MVTGGEAWNGTHRLAGSRVQVYGTAGAGKRLPDMNTPRMYHACGHYIRDDKVVTTFRDIQHVVDNNILYLADKMHILTVTFR